ncbi:CU044_5270 family protein [Amycolatopsis sp. EV170708-02-1]|uniref:CU044_5270 family protein n=1 Tax=Amycolatopsis sp. EV170708-02-1 TaxID=2919322 RepID=UPI001F0CC661|nr:CU044_5270 family protein [Amycolatopsis sp. EV170708-02-1]UMP05559.1 CU044_5270 family protein [Amycolatopsis sp. EV170708-02-1]
MWSEAELDEALAGLHAGPETRQDELSRARAALLRAAGEVEDELLPTLAPRARKRPGAWRWIAAAAAAALVSGGGIVATNAFTDGDGTAPADHSVTAPGEDVLDSLHGDDFPLRDDQYRLVTESTWTTRVTKSGLVYQTHEILERWLPVPGWKPIKSRFTGTGEIRWIKGDYQTAMRNGEALPGPSSTVSEGGGAPPTTTTTSVPPPRATNAPPVLPPQDRLPSESGWTRPDPGFLEELPIDPVKMAERLRHDGIWPDGRPSGQQNSTPEMFEMAFNVLRSSQGFGAQRVALCKALAKMPGIVLETVTTPDGRPALSFSVTLPNQTRTFIVDRATAAVVGSRAVRPSDQREEWPGLTLFDTKISVTITDDGGP